MWGSISSLGTSLQAIASEALQQEEEEDASPSVAPSSNGVKSKSRRGSISDLLSHDPDADDTVPKIEPTQAPSPAFLRLEEALKTAEGKNAGYKSKIAGLEQANAMLRKQQADHQKELKAQDSKHQERVKHLAATHQEDMTFLQEKIQEDQVKLLRIEEQLRKQEAEVARIKRERDKDRAILEEQLKQEKQRSSQMAVSHQQRESEQQSTKSASVLPSENEKRLAAQVELLQEQLLQEKQKESRQSVDLQEPSENEIQLAKKVELLVEQLAQEKQRAQQLELLQEQLVQEKLEHEEQRSSKLGLLQKQLEQEKQRSSQLERLQNLLEQEKQRSHKLELVQEELEHEKQRSSKLDHLQKQIEQEQQQSSKVALLQEQLEQERQRASKFELLHKQLESGKQTQLPNTAEVPQEQNFEVEKQQLIGKIELLQEQLQQAITNTENIESQKQREVGDWQEKYDKQSKALERLRAHLIEKEESQTVELMESEKRYEELARKMGANEKKQSEMSAAVVKYEKLLSDYKEKELECEQNAVAVMNLQSILEQVQTERDDHMRYEMVKLNKELSKAQETIRVLQERLQDSERVQQRCREAEEMVSQLHEILNVKSRELIKLQEEVDPLRRGFEESLKRLQNATENGKNLVDKRLVSKLFVTYLSRSNQREVLGIMSNILGWTEEEQIQVGLKQPARRSSWLFFGAGDSSPSRGQAASTAPADKTLTDLWVEFLLKEASSTSTTSPSASSGSSSGGSRSSGNAHAGIMGAPTTPALSQDTPSAASGLPPLEE